MTSTYDSTGIVLDKYAEILARQIELAQENWGTSIYTAKDELLGHLIVVISTIIGELNEILQDVYDEKSVSNSTGTHLENLLELIGLTRQAAAYSTVTLTLTASGATTVPAGTRYATASEIIFATDSAVVFTGAGTDDVTATCTVVGANNAAIGEVNVIKDTVYNITSVTNAAVAIPGRVRETDAQLKARHTVAVSTSGDHDAASVYEAVTAVTGVSAAFVYDNDTPSSYQGIPANSLYVSVIGGSDDDIAEAIATSKTASVTTSGSQSVSVYNETTSQSKTIYFDRAEEVDVYITIEGTYINGVFPDNGETLIADELITYFNALKINDDVVFTNLYRPVYSQAGLIVTNMYIGTASSPTGQVDLTMTKLMRPVISSDKIVFDLTEQ
jgi:hypothetical protein